MIWLIARKDFLLNLISARFIIGFLLCLFLIPFTLVVSLDRYKSQQDIYEINAEKVEKSIKENRVYSTIRPKIVRYPEPLSIFSEGITENLGYSTELQLKEYPLFLDGQISTVDNPLLNVFFTIDFTTIIATIISLLALVFSYDCFTREREDGVLKLVLANHVSRIGFLTGKLLGILITLLPLLIFCYLLGILFITLSPSIQLNGGSLLTILMLFLSSVLYTIVFVLLGMFISSMVHRSSTSIIVSLLIWIWFVFLVPNIASYIAKSFVKTGTYTNLSFALDNISKECSNKKNEKSKEIEKSLGIDGISCWNCTFGEDDEYLESYGMPLSTIQYHLQNNAWSVPVTLDYADKKWIVQKQYYDELSKQEKVQRMLALVSPSELFQQLSSSLCYTDANSYQIFMDNVRRYRQEVVNYFVNAKLYETLKWFTPVAIENQANDEELAYYKTHNAWDEYQKKYSKYWIADSYPLLQLGDFPRFHYKPQITGTLLNNVLLRFALLFAIALILFICTATSFRNYQM